MRKVDVQIKFVTPAFIGGSENRNISEFRIASLKGLLRFWWRVFQDEPNEKSLYEKEKNIFGDTTCKSSFSIILKQPLQLLVHSSNRTGAFLNNQPGVKYLFYSMYRMGRSPGRINWLKPDTKVDFQLIFFNKQCDKEVKEVLTSLWWLENFGGIGARSRRGAGSFQVTKIEGIEGIEGIPQFMFKNQNLSFEKGVSKEDKTKEINKFFRYNGIINKATYLSQQPRPPSPVVPPYTAFRKGISEYKVLIDNFKTWDDAANDIGTRLADFRRSDRINTHAPFHNEAINLHNFAVTGKTSITSLTKSAFGLPIIYRFRNRNPLTQKKKFLIDESVQVSREKHSRRGSPLFIKIGKLPGINEYYVIALSLWSEFLPANERIQLKQISYGRATGTTDLLDQPSSTAIDNFLNSL